MIGGRIADASLFLAPLIHEFGWGADQWDLLAAGVAGGHLSECSGQVTGGNYSGDWWVDPDPSLVGFPIGEFEPDGTFVVTKPAGSEPGHVRHGARAAALRGADPTAYLNPDVTVDLASARLDDLGGDRVLVSGVHRQCGTDHLQGPGVPAGRLVR